MKFEFCAQTDPGRVRANNEDALAFDQATQLALLADGMGGYNAGEVASAMATALIKEELARGLLQAGPQATGAQVRRAIETSVAAANRAIFQAARSNPQYTGMGTTLVLGVFQPDRLLLGHIGDSRCYRWRGQALVQLTRDHSLLQEQIDAGLLTPAQAATSPIKNWVTRALGVEAEVRLELHEHPLAPGDLYLMCSDGLSDMLDAAAIAGILHQGGSLAHLAQQLVGLANARGGRDNISVLLTQAGEPCAQRGLISRILGP